MDTILPLQFQLLFNWQREDEINIENRMYPVFKVDLNHTSVYRLIHHDFEQHYLSAGQLFQACGLTITEGFFLFDLKHSDFEVDFMNIHFPFCDVWVSMDQGRRMVRALGCEEELRLLVSTMLDDCYSTDNMNRNEMMHNWTVPSIPHLQYSTRALLETTFDRVELVSQKIRTQISRRVKQQGIVMKDRAQNGLVRWQVWTYELFLMDEPVTDRSGAVWDTLQGLLFDLQTLSREGRLEKKERVLSDNMMIGNMPLKKEYLSQSAQLQQIYIAVMIEKAMNELNRIKLKSETTEDQVIKNQDSLSPPPPPPLPEQPSPRPITIHSSSSSSNSVDNHKHVGVDNHILFHDRLDLFEQELYRMKRKAKKKFEEIDLTQQQMIQQLNEFNFWKIKFEKNRKSERIWMLMFMLTTISAILVFLK